MPTEPTPGARPARFAGRLRRLLLLILVAPVWAAPSASPPEAVITDAGDFPLQMERMELLRDPTRDLDLADVRASEIARDFTPAPPGKANLGITQDAVWARFAVRNATDEALPLLLVLAEPRMAQVAFWALDKHGEIIAERRDGRFADPAERDRSHRWFLFDLPLAAGQTATVYVRVRTDMGLLLDLRLGDRTSLAVADRAGYGWLALYFGALLFMLAYNLLLLLQLREATYFWLCAVIVGVMLWVADREGLLTTLIWRLWPDPWSGNQTGVAIALVGIFMFPVGFLRLREHAPGLRWMHLALAAPMVCVPFLYTVSPTTAYGVSQAIALLGGLAMLATGVLALRWQPRAAVQYLTAWSPLLVAILLIVLTNYGITPQLSAVWALSYIGLLLMLLLLSVAQADRVNELRRHAERSQAALARNEARLTELVAARTRELATARDRAEAANRAKTQFLASMSHDLRTPLNAVLGAADLLRRSPRLGAEEQGQCGLIQRGGRHLLRLIEDLLDIARIEHEGLRPVITEVALQPMLQDLIVVTRRQAEAKGLAFTAHLAPDLPDAVRTDGRRVRQVLQNLLDNAVKYTDAGSVNVSAALDRAASVSADPDSITLLFTVTDTGRGIAETDRERLFSPFEQHNHTDAGSGLGLAICRELTAALGGELTLISAPGCGTRFDFLLPVRPVSYAADRDATEPNQAPIVGYTGPRRRVLVIDDSEVNRLLMAGLLQALGFDADTAADAEAALARARRRPPDLVITDLRMPGTCGYAAVWQLRQALGRPDLPAIAASASPLPEPGDAAALGFDAFLLKPIEQGALCAALGECLELAWLRGDATAVDRGPLSGAEPASAGPMASAAERPLLPCWIELEAALELAERQDWTSLREWCTELEAAFPECADFAARVRVLLGRGDAAPGSDAAALALRRLLAEAR
jgi:signal transduction histidine kinase/CheY-like chemotaxis protein